MFKLKNSNYRVIFMITSKENRIEENFVVTIELFNVCIS